MLVDYTDDIMLIGHEQEVVKAPWFPGEWKISFMKIRGPATLKHFQEFSGLGNARTSYLSSYIPPLRKRHNV